jgi:cytochrome c oxidase subunit 1
MYIEISLTLGALGALQSLLFRAELSSVGSSLLLGDGHYYNILITSHGLVIVFGFIMPIAMGGLGNFLVPVLSGIPDMVFPRVNNLSIWVLVWGVGFLGLGSLSEEGVGSG